MNCKTESYAGNPVQVTGTECAWMSYKSPTKKTDAFLMTALIGLAGLMLLSGCRGAPPAEERFQFNLQPGPVEPPKVMLAPGDVVDVKFYYAPDLNEEEQTVRPDGMITLQLVGDVLVQGKTPAEVRAELRELFSNHLKNPEVAVIVDSLVDRRVYVGGEVNDPGMYDMPGRLTALEAVMAAGGFNLETAKVSNVLVIRHKNGQRYGGALDFSGALKGEEFQPFMLEPYDIVYVPETTIVGITRWIDQHINQIIPIGFTLTQSRGNTTIGLDTGFAGRR